MARLPIALALVVFALGSASAEDKQRMVGGWIVQAGEDRFTDGFKRVIAMRPDNGVSAFGARCLSNRVSFVLSDLTLRRIPSERVTIEFRADRGRIFNTEGQALDRNVIQFAAKPGMLKAIAESKEFALRARVGDVTFDRVFSSGGAREVIKIITDSCPSHDG
ncbi:MAG TPA: hypothetical protein VHN11_18375 [Xanthobacteraceae bacterium]|nr:hypothetical protein [Xanthobacteraceae bacterium]